MCSHCWSKRLNVLILLSEKTAIMKMSRLISFFFCIQHRQIRPIYTSLRSQLEFISPYLHQHWPLLCHRTSSAVIADFAASKAHDFLELDCRCNICYSSGTYKIFPLTLSIHPQFPPFSCTLPIQNCFLLYYKLTITFLGYSVALKLCMGSDHVISKPANFIGCSTFYFVKLFESWNGENLFSREYSFPHALEFSWFRWKRHSGQKCFVGILQACVNWLSVAWKEKRQVWC